VVVEFVDLFIIPSYALLFIARRGRMTDDNQELDQKQSAYKTAVEAWVAAIREEEDLASGDHSLAEVDKWEAAHFIEEEARDKAKEAKKEYENALREKFFGF
jgi:dsRNA-specific ribonuclease